MHVTMTVNGDEVERDIEPRVLLVHFLREDLGLTGTHWGCDTSNCGTCVVQVDGQPVKSCTVLAAMTVMPSDRRKILGADVCLVGQYFIITGFQVGIEGISNVGALHLDEELSFFHVVIEAGPYVHHPPTGQRDDGNLAVDIGIHGSGDV